MALNFAGKAGLTAAGSFSGTHVDVHEFAPQGHGDTITVPDPYLLFSGDYKRSGPDLILSRDGREHVVENYFSGEKRAALAAPDGARLSGDLVNALTGHVQVAQASGAPDPGKVIGHVTKLAGNATVIRNGVSIVLNMGDNVHKGDVVQSGSNSSLGITFIDGTVFGLASNARMVLNEMVYDPNGSSNSSFLSLVQGSITFLAGETAKHGDMKIDTPVATMGIRGTACLVEINFDVSVTDPNSSVPLLIPVKFQVLQEKDGTVGSYFLYAKTDLTYSNPIATINRAGEVTSFSANGLITVTQLTQIAPEVKAIIDQTLGLNSQNPNNPNPQSNGPGGSGVTPDSNIQKDTSPLKDIPVGTPTPLQIPINFQDPDKSGQIIHETVNVTVTVLKKIDVAPVVDKSGFSIAEQVTITDSNPSDVLTPYVPGSGRVQAVTGPAYTPEGIELKNFVTVDQSTGHVSYDPGAFAFLKAGDKAVVTIDFDSAAGSDTFHESLTVTISGINDAPVIENATIAVSQGGTVVLTGANVGITDPDNTKLTFTVSNVTHGKFQVTTDGVTWVEATTFTTADLSAGHVRFMHDGGEAAPTFSIQADDGEPLNHLSSTVAGAVDFTNVDIAPVITHASLTVAQGHTVVLTTADIDFVDPVSPVVTYTVSNLSHGHFEFGSGNEAQPTTTFTSTDVAAGLVSFVHDGSSGKPAFSLTPNDGTVDGATVDGAVTFSAANYTLISAEGVIINVTTEGATSGFVFPDAGNVTTPGIPEDRIAIGYDVGGSHVVLDNAPLLGVHQMAPVSSETHSAGGTTFVSTKLDAGHGVTLTQTLALASDANFFTTTIDIANGGTSDISNLRFLRNFDPDQDAQAHNDYRTFNDVVQNPDGAETFAIFSATGVESGTRVAMVGLGAEWRASVYGLTNTDPYATHAFDVPTDPDGALADLSLSLTSSLGTLAAGSHIQVTYVTTNNIATEGSNALYGTAGDDFIEGLGGADLLIGLGGADTFVFSPGSGHDTVEDFTPGTDKLQINYFAVVPEAGLITEADLDAWKATGAFESVGGDTLIHLTPTDSILLKNVSIADLHAVDFGGHADDEAPVAVDDSNAVTAGGSTILGSVILNDSDADGDTLSVSNVQSGTAAGSSIIVEGVFGELSLSKSTGTYFYKLGASLDQNDPVHAAQANAVQALAVGAHATETFTYTVSDGTLSDDAVLRITVTGVNDAPVVTSAALTVSEGGTALLSVANIGVSDPDSTSFTFTASNVSHGTFQTTADGVHWAGATTFTTADLKADHVRFVHDGSEDAPTFSIQADDGAGSNSLSNVFAGSVTFTNINDAPVNSVPGAQSLNEDAILTFSSGTGNAISVSDVDERAGFPESVTLLVQHGTLTLGSTVGLQSFINNSSVVLLSGSVASLNHALQGLTYRPNANYNGPDSLSVIVGDNGNTGSPFTPLFDQDTVAITVSPVNDAPVNHVPAAQTVNEDTNLVFTGANAITISDVDGGSGDETVTLTVTGGTLALGSTASLTSFTNNAASITLTGTVSHINTALNGLTYKGILNFNGADSLVVSTNDDGNTGTGGPLSDTNSIAINVTPVNDAPAIMGGDFASVSVVENTSGAFTTVHADDPDNPTLTYSIISGVDSPDTSSFKINSATGALSFVHAPDFEHPADSNHNNIYTVQVKASDGSLSDTQTLFVHVTDVNEAPHAVDDVVITNNVNNSTYKIPDWALLANDTDPDGNPLSLTAITASSEFASIDLTTNPGNVTVHDLFVGGAFTYRASDGSLNDTANVTVTQDTGTMNGGSGNEIFVGDSNGTTINANGGNDILVGNAGNDILNGGSGNDTYVFGLHDGHDVVNDTSGLDTIRIEAGGTALSGLSFAENTTHDLVIQFNGQQVTVDDHFIGDDNVGGLQFDGGASYDGYSVGSDLYSLSNDSGFNRAGTSGNDILSGDGNANSLSGSDGNDLLFGNAGNDTLNGGSGNDLLVGGSGNDLMTGGSGNDQFVFAAGFGKDIITDFVPGHDRIDLFAVVSTNNIDGWIHGHVTASPINMADTLITIDPSDTITLHNVLAASLHASDFIVHPVT